MATADNDDEQWKGFGEHPEGFYGNVPISIQGLNSRVVTWLDLTIGDAKFQRYSAVAWIQIEPHYVELDKEQCKAIESAARRALGQYFDNTLIGQSMRFQGLREKGLQ